MSLFQSHLAVMIFCAIVSALIWHATTEHFLLAAFGAGVTVGTISMLVPYLRTGFLPPVFNYFWIFALIGFVIALGIGIPFYRRRNGKGLGPPIVEKIDV